MKDYIFIPVPQGMQRHRADIKWLEEHGQEALAEYTKLYPPGYEREALGKFAKVMFEDPATQMLMAWVPMWYRKIIEEEHRQFRREARALSPKVAEGTDRIVEATVVETR